MSRKRAGRKLTSSRPPSTLRASPPQAATVPLAKADERPAARHVGVRPTSITCDWCARPTVVKPRGRVPRWCSETCRHRSWEQDRAAASGRSAIQIVERVVQVTAATSPAKSSPALVDWPETLAALAAQLDGGRIYDRDLIALSTALAGVLAAYERHPGVRSRQ